MCTDLAWGESCPGLNQLDENVGMSYILVCRCRSSERITGEPEAVGFWQWPFVQCAIHVQRNADFCVLSACGDR